MRIDALTLDFFRNYTHLETRFDPDVNVIYGDNAQGKTNLLEAVAYLSGLSHRARYDRELIQFGVEKAFLKGEVSSRQRPFFWRLSSAEAPAAAAEQRRAAEEHGTAAEVFQTVLFCPEDLYLIRDGAAARRKFLDDCLCQLRPRYAGALQEYKRLHEHKTRILRDSEEKPSLLETLDEFSLGMAKAGAVLIHYRAHFIRLLEKAAPEIHADFSGGRERLSLQYETVSTVTDPLAPSSEIFTQLLRHQESHRAAELASRTCLSVPTRMIWPWRWTNGPPGPSAPRDRPERRRCP